MILDRATAAFPPGGMAVVVGAGAIGGAVADRIEAAGSFARVLRLSRSADPAFDVTEESAIARIGDAIVADGRDLRLVFVATGFLHNAAQMPEKALRDLDPAHLAHAFAVNAIGPALLMKHLLPRFPRTGKAVFATLSARVGSIGDNRLGGWYAYRASKAALNQLVRTATAPSPG